MRCHRLDGELVGLGRPISGDAAERPCTYRRRSDKDRAIVMVGAHDPVDTGRSKKAGRDRGET